MFLILTGEICGQKQTIKAQYTDPVHISNYFFYNKKYDAEQHAGDIMIVLKS
jgi:hypothetical protein